MSGTTVTSKKGNLNPMYGKRHDLQTKKKISDTQKARWAAIKKMCAEKQLYELADTSYEARKNMVQHLIENNNLTFENVQQALTFLSTTLGEQHIKKVIDAEIAKLIKECKKV